MSAVAVLISIPAMSPKHSRQSHLPATVTPTAARATTGQASTAVPPSSRWRRPIIAICLCAGMWGGWFATYRYVTGIVPHERRYADGKIYERGFLKRQPGSLFSPAYKQHGAWETYDPQGRTRSHTEYDDGALHGRRQEWGDQGRIIRDEVWEHGRLISGTVAGSGPENAGAGS